MTVVTWPRPAHVDAVASVLVLSGLAEAETLARRFAEQAKRSYGHRRVRRLARSLLKAAVAAVPNPKEIEVTMGTDLPVGSTVMLQGDEHGGPWVVTRVSSGGRTFLRRP